MLQIVYASSATKAFSKAELVELLTQVRAKNSRLGVTGMLLYKDGNFLQVIEGEEAIIRGLYQSLEKDMRHHGLVMLDENKIAERQFGNWSMAFRNLGDRELHAIPGFSQFMNTGLDPNALKTDLTGCWDLLRLFQENM